MKLKTILLAAAAVSAPSFIATPASAQASDMYLGQLMLTPYNFCPRGWTGANGQILAISTNTALFSLLGTTYGGNGQTTFALPDLRGRVPNSTGQGPGLQLYSLGQVGGTEATTLTINQMPIHNHVGNLIGTSALVDDEKVKKASLGTFPAGASQYSRSGTPDTTMAAGSVTTNTAGGSQPFSVMNPYLTMQWCIALQGIFPSRN